MGGHCCKRFSGGNSYIVLNHSNTGGRLCDLFYGTAIRTLREATSPSYNSNTLCRLSVPSFIFDFDVLTNACCRIRRTARRITLSVGVGKPTELCTRWTDRGPPAEQWQWGRHVKKKNWIKGDTWISFWFQELD